MRLKKSVLVLCESELRLSIAITVLRNHFHAVGVSTPIEAIKAMEERPYDVLLLYYTCTKRLTKLLNLAEQREAKVLGAHGTEAAVSISGTHVFGSNMATIIDRIKILAMRKRGPKKVAA